MLLTQTVRLKLNNSEKDILANLCHLSKNLFNVGLYTVRQYFFPLIIPIRKRHNFAKDDWMFKIPTSRKYTREQGSVYITVPPNIRGNRIKEIRRTQLVL